MVNFKFNTDGIVETTREDTTRLLKDDSNLKIYLDTSTNMTNKPDIEKSEVLASGVKASKDFLYSTSFGPCVAVIIQYDDASYGLFHAQFVSGSGSAIYAIAKQAHPHPELIDEDDAEYSINRFSIDPRNPKVPGLNERASIKKIIVFEKTTYPKHKDAVSKIKKVFSEKMKLSAVIEIIEVENYVSLCVDVKQNSLYLAMNEIRC